MRMHKIHGFVCLAWLAFVSAGEPVFETLRPAGDYAQVRLDFSIPGAPALFQTWAYQGALRDGVLAIDHGMGLRTPGGTLRLQGDRLEGRFTRMHGRRNPVGTAEVIVEARVGAGGAIGGLARIGDAEGTVRGTIHPEAELRGRNDIAETFAWPNFLGPAQGGLAASSPATADPADFRLLWRSEETDIGQGIGSISRFMDGWQDSNGLRTGSGSSSPVLAHGRIYLSYHVPSPTLSEEAEAKFAEARKKLAEAAGVAPEAVPEHALEKIWPATDDIVLCLDAATGQTLWKTRIPARGRNLQHHKNGPYNMSPAVSDGRVFALGMDGDLYAFDALTGEPLWSRKIGSNNSHHSIALSAVPGVVIAPTARVWSGFDAATGEPLWTSKVPAASAAVQVWQHQGRWFILSGTGNRLVDEGRGESIACLDALSGAEAWRIEVPDQPAAIHSAGRGSGPGGLTMFRDILFAYEIRTTGADKTERRANLSQRARAWRLSPTGAEELWSVDIPPHNGEHVPVVLHGKLAVLGGPGGLVLVDLQKGNVVARHEGVGPSNGGYMQGMGDLLLVRRDGTHGHPDFQFYRVDEGANILDLTPEAWAPPLGGGTSSYHHPLYYPMADGRMFIRMADGLYAFDLRKP